MAGVVARATTSAFVFLEIYVDNLLTIMQDRGLLTATAAQRVQALLAQGEPLESAVLAADGVSEESLLRFLATSFDLPYVDLEQSPPMREFIATFPARLLLRHHVLPLHERDGTT